MKQKQLVPVCRLLTGIIHLNLFENTLKSDLTTQDPLENLYKEISVLFLRAVKGCGGYIEASVCKSHVMGKMLLIFRVI